MDGIGNRKGENSMRTFALVATFLAAAGCTVLIGYTPRATTLTVVNVVPAKHSLTVWTALSDSYQATLPPKPDESGSVSDFRAAITAPPGKIPAQFTFTQ